MAKINDTVTEYDVLEAMRIDGGGFIKALAEAWARADMNNKAKLMRAFGDYYDEYCERAKEIAMKRRVVRNFDVRKFGHPLTSD